MRIFALVISHIVIFALGWAFNVAWVEYEHKVCQNELQRWMAFAYENPDKCIGMFDGDGRKYCIMFEGEYVEE